MKYLRMFADQKGDSHFEHAELSSNKVPFMPPAPSVTVTNSQSVDNLVFMRVPRQVGRTMVSPRPESNG